MILDRRARLATAVCAGLLIARIASGAIPGNEGPLQDRVQRLVQDLKSPARWAEGWDGLLTIGLPAVPALREALQDDDGVLAVRAAAVLYRMGSSGGLRPLVERLNSDQTDVRALAVTVLRILSGRRFGYDPGAPAEERRAAVARWREWVEDRLARPAAPERPAVAAVDNAEGMVVLSAGAQDGVKQGDAYTLARGDQFVAVVEVIRVLPRLCVARVRDGQVAGPIHLGDVALPGE